MRYWKCVHCGKTAQDSEEFPDKKIRRNLKGFGDKKCHCISYNQPEDWQYDEAVTLDLPDFYYIKKKISVDYCIVPVIQELWKHQIATHSSCCGHNKDRPSLIFSENLTKVEADRIREIIKKVDDRPFEILSWKLTEIRD